MTEDGRTFVEEAAAASYLGVGLRRLRSMTRKGQLTDYYRQGEGGAFTAAYDLDDLRLFKMNRRAARSTRRRRTSLRVGYVTHSPQS